MWIQKKDIAEGWTQSIQDDQGRHEVGMVENTVKTPLGINQEGCLFEAR